jgi:hypothetical protein
MTPENNPRETPMDAALEQAVSEIREESLDPAVVEAAAARVWTRLAEQVAGLPDHIRTCADFQALIPEFRAKRLPQARALLLQDHLHQCVQCRHVYEGKVTTMPVPAARRSGSYKYAWAIAAALIAGVSIYIVYDRSGAGSGRAIVQTVNGTLWEVSDAGFQPLAAGQNLPDGVEIRTAKDSSAMLLLRDGSTVELRERSGFSTSQSASDLTIHLDRGSVIVQAAKRHTGHLFVDTADCHVAVTGTVFSVTSGVKGSRVSVIAGEVHVTQDNQEKILHGGDQTVTSTSVEPESVKDDISWSANRIKLLQELREKFDQIHLPDLRYSSRLLDRLPASTVLYASIPNLAEYLAEAQSTFREKLAESPALQSLGGGSVLNLDLIEKLRTASEYLGDEIAVVGVAGPGERPQGPVFFAETKRDGFPEFLKKEAGAVPLITRGNLVAFSPSREALNTFAPALDTASGSFPGTPFYARISEAYHEGAGLLLCADLSRMSASQAYGGPSYFIGGQKEVEHHMEASASLGFNGVRTGFAAWLAEPSPMGSLDFVSPEATFAAAFVVKDPGAIVDMVVAQKQGLVGADDKSVATPSVRSELGASLGGEFALAIDGPVIPVPSWKLVAETYDPARFQATLQKIVDGYNQDAVKSNGKPIRTGQETVEGRTYYMIGSGDMNPLLEAHYTFAGGYLVAGPTRALVSRALQLKASGTSVKRSQKFLDMTPPDRSVHFSGVIYENLGTTLSPIIGLLSAFAPQAAAHSGALQSLANPKPMLIAAEAAPDRITVTTNGNVLGDSLSNLMSGNVLGMSGIPMPFFQKQGTHAPRMPYR